MKSKCCLQKKLIIIIIIMTVGFIGLLVSCKPKEWPPTIFLELKSKFEEKDEYFIIVSILGEKKVDDALHCIINKLKIAYPDYAFFEREYNKKGFDLIRDYFISCFTGLLGPDYSLIKKAYIASPQYKQFINNSGWSKYHADDYINCYFEKFQIQWPAPDLYIKTAFTQKLLVSNITSSFAKSCEEEINFRIAKELENIRNLNNLFDYNSYQNAYFIIKNDRNFPIDFCVAYYYYGEHWQGWTSEGWFHAEPGQLITIDMPNTINRYIYYYARSSNGVFTWSGSESFIIMDDYFKIPNADKPNTLSYSSEFRYLNKFLKHDLGQNYTEYTLRLN